ncbi:MAG: hypothetical protein KDI98_05970 [Hyphomicrobiaceae bacterium]|nr:hypothetical protein [Hyphomicrobiaceae bacterium]
MSSHPLSRIVLHLARTKDFPEGSKHHGYEIVAPLDAEAHISAEGWKAHRDRCRVRRFWGNDDDDIGHLVHRPGGSWAIRYDIAGDEDDEAGYRFGAHAFRLGEYVSIRDDEDELHAFRVVSVTEVP